MQRQIFYHDTDAGGIVYYANYLKYLEEARTEYMEQRGLTVAFSLESGLFYAVRSCNLLYRAPARYGDIISANAKVEKFTGAQIFFQQQVINHVTGKMLVEALVSLVVLNKAFKPCPVPQEFIEKCHEDIS